ncbi:MAG: hypothetical protein SVU32_01185, partial [Candidatus Nanohaloarchaea archaeon]|nr:hypothetical protein [Candidatus Nanohaloarchaea archaeon]
QTGNIDGCPHIFLRGTATGGSLQPSLEGVPEWLPRDRIDKVRWRQDHAHLSQYLDTPPEDI